MVEQSFGYCSDTRAKLQKCHTLNEYFARPLAASIYRKSARVPLATPFKVLNRTGREFPQKTLPNQSRHDDFIYNYDEVNFSELSQKPLPNG
jgi:hypothetical protein